MPTRPLSWSFAGRLWSSTNISADFTASRAQRPNGPSPLSCLGRYLVNHADVGAEVLARWNLPMRLVEAVRHHHNPSQASAGPSLVPTRPHRRLRLQHAGTSRAGGRASPAP
ncbi:MAG: HDOD domain-containing protein [Planctomycetota bacterium]